jgi:hypothetical protein
VVAELGGEQEDARVVALVAHRVQALGQAGGLEDLVADLDEAPVCGAPAEALRVRLPVHDPRPTVHDDAVAVRTDIVTGLVEGEALLGEHILQRGERARDPSLAEAFGVGVQLAAMLGPRRALVTRERRQGALRDVAVHDERLHGLQLAARDVAEEAEPLELLHDALAVARARQGRRILGERRARSRRRREGDGQLAVGGGPRGVGAALEQERDGVDLAMRHRLVQRCSAVHMGIAHVGIGAVVEEDAHGLELAPPRRPVERGPVEAAHVVDVCAETDQRGERGHGVVGRRAA